jgi:hypothetical protein
VDQRFTKTEDQQDLAHVQITAGVIILNINLLSLRIININLKFKNMIKCHSPRAKFI